MRASNFILYILEIEVRIKDKKIIESLVFRILQIISLIYKYINML